jgi:hypothetical protein
MTLFADCGDSVEMTVNIGMISEATTAGIWDVALWDTGTWGTGIVPVDVSAWVRSFTSSRSFQSGQDVWNAGSLTLVLDNRDGRFSPDNVATTPTPAPYASGGISGVRPGCPISVLMTYAGIEYPVFTGYVTSWGESWTEHGTVFNPSDCNNDPENLDRVGDAFMTVTATDVWGRLGAQRRRVPVSPAVGAGDDYGQRIARLLVAADFSGSMYLSAGAVTFQETTLESETIGEINKVVQSEGGVCYADADGTIVARGRYDPLTDPRSTTPQIYFGDKAGETLWSTLTVAPVSDDRIVNHAVFACSGGTDQEASDPVSISIHGIHDDDQQPTDLLCQTDAQVLGLAQWAVLVGAYPEATVEQIELKPRCDLATLAPLALGSKIRDLVSIRVRPPSAQYHYLDRECFISGITHTVSENDWTFKINTSTAKQYRRFAGSRWDEGVWGSSDIDPNAALWFL